MRICLDVGGPFGGTQVQQRAIITNNSGATIPGSTDYTYVIAGHQFTQRSPSALAPTQQLNVPGMVGGTAGYNWQAPGSIWVSLSQR